MGMSVPDHVTEAASRIELAEARIEQARAKAPTMETLREWLEALTAYTEALSDLHRFTNESVHEKLHELAARVGLEALLQGSPRQRTS
jgi:hypothetical protein